MQLLGIRQTKSLMTKLVKELFQLETIHYCVDVNNVNNKKNKINKIEIGE